MVLYKVYVINSFPPFETFLGDFTDIHSAKVVIQGFHDTQYKCIDYLDRFQQAETFEALETIGNVTVRKWIVGETDINRGIPQF